MTRRARRPEGDGLPPPEDYDAMFRAADAYRRRFGEAVGTWQFMGSPREFAREVQAAIRRGEKLTDAELYRRLGQEPSPPDAIL